MSKARLYFVCSYETWILFFQREKKTRENVRGREGGRERERERESLKVEFCVPPVIQYSGCVILYHMSLQTWITNWNGSKRHTAELLIFFRWPKYLYVHEFYNYNIAGSYRVVSSKEPNWIEFNSKRKWVP